MIPAISLAQLNVRVGDFDFQVDRILGAYQLAYEAGSRLLITPELSLCGYLPQDHWRRPEFFDNQERALHQLRQATLGRSCALVLGLILPPIAPGRLPLNGLCVLENGECVFTQAKTLLPRQDVFEEPRYFEPATEIQLWRAPSGDLRVAFAICEDLWGHRPDSPYDQDPVLRYQALKPDLVVAIAASPYEWGKHPKRLAIHQEVVATLGVPLIYVNRVGSLDSLLFEGHSFVLGAQEEVVFQAPAWKTGVWHIPAYFPDTAMQVSSSSLEGAPGNSPLAELVDGLIMGIRDYFTQTGFQRAVLGLSGGIDSAVVAVLAAKALGPQNILAIALPGPYSAPESEQDAALLASSLGLIWRSQSIQALVPAFWQNIGPPIFQSTSWSGLSQENLQARLRGLFLMTFANQEKALVLGTSNKSELAMGYTTLYGDLIGAFAPLGDVYKTQVYELAFFLQQQTCVFPERILKRPPSAELSPGQTDQDFLPPYALLDAVLEAYLEQEMPLKELHQLYGPALDQTVLPLDRLIQLFHLQEYKRQQAPFVLKISKKAFGRGRRVSLLSHCAFMNGIEDAIDKGRSLF